MLSQEKRDELIRVFSDIIRIESANPPGDEKEVIDYLKALLAENGIESRVYAQKEGRDNLYASMGEGDEPPIMFLSHVDVVPAPGEWKYPPLSAFNDNGTIYGRGALDTKQITAMQVMAMIWLKREGVKLNRQLVFLATADEEAGSTYGMKYLSTEHPELIPKGYVISEGGGFVIKQGEHSYRTCACGEKGGCRIKLTVVKGSGSSYFDPKGSLSGKLLEALLAVSAFKPKEKLTAPTQKFYETVEGVIEDPTLRNLWQYATKDSLAAAGHDIVFDENSPDSMDMNLVCQFIHGTTRQEIEETLGDLLKDTDASFEITEITEGYICDMNNLFLDKLREISKRYDPQTRMLPMIALGRTDGRFIRHNVYGYSPILADVPFSEVLKKVHQTDECITEDSLCYGARVIYETVFELAVQDDTGKGGRP